MTLLFRILISFSLLFSFLAVSAQQPVLNGDNFYGLDPLLYNGRSYTYFLPSTTGGSQYLNDSQFENGSVTIRGITFHKLALNYDIFNQELILKYKTNLAGTSIIIISDAWLESFSLRDMDFEVITSQDTLKRIYQVMGTGPNRILYFWKKDLELDNVQGSKKYTFTSAKKEMFLYRGGNILKYRNNKTFFSLFGSERSTIIKEYLKKNKIKVKKVTDKTMTKLISYCNSL
jgi:hypothetical protein